MYNKKFLALKPAKKSYPNYSLNENTRFSDIGSSAGSGHKHHSSTTEGSENSMLIELVRQSAELMSRFIKAFLIWVKTDCRVQLIYKFPKSKMALNKQPLKHHEKYFLALKYRNDIWFEKISADYSTSSFDWVIYKIQFVASFDIPLRSKKTGGLLGFAWSHSIVTSVSLSCATISNPFCFSES